MIGIRAQYLRFAEFILCGNYFYFIKPYARNKQYTAQAYIITIMYYYVINSNGSVKYGLMWPGSSGGKSDLSSTR